MSADSKMMFADLPPSSSATGLRLRPALAAMARPVAVPPVKPTMSMPGWLTSASPVTLPRPLTRLTTPGGRPASCITSIMRRTDNGVYSDGFSTQVLPKGMQVATRMEDSASGAFHGEMTAATPFGSRVTTVRNPAVWL